MNESFKTDPSLATSARAAKESGSYLCASNVTPTAVRFIVSVFLCLLCSCRMPSTQMTCSHFRKNRPKKRQKPAGCRSRIISKNRPVPIFGRSTGASLVLIWLFTSLAPCHYHRFHCGVQHSRSVGTQFNDLAERNVKNQEPAVISIKPPMVSQLSQTVFWNFSLFI